ncbi:MAG: ferrochelatase [Vampirovibrionales bacterium]|nr:ferrochelatase [Vampirovibrionales bacterium]
MKKKRKPYTQPFVAPYCPSAGKPLSLSAHTGVLLLNMGGPDSQDSVKPFLLNLFSDPDILRLPPLLQPLLARYIVNSRGDEAKANYAEMPGGGSPQLPLTRRQAEALTECLIAKGLTVTTAVAMRYWHPYTTEALSLLRAERVEQLVVVSLYPHFSYTTTGSSLNELRRELARMGWDVPITVVSGYCKEDWYLESLAQCIQTGLDDGHWSCPIEDVQLLFSAHSLPLLHCKKTGDPYERLTVRSVATVMKRHFPCNPWDMGFQSKVGNMKWLGPATDGVLTYFAAQKMDNILVVPVSFVSDHIETLVELDIEYIPEARELGLKHVHRAPVMNTHPSFIRGLAQSVVASIQQREDAVLIPAQRAKETVVAG